MKNLCAYLLHKRSGCGKSGVSVYPLMTLGIDVCPEHIVPQIKMGAAERNDLAFNI